MNGLDFNTSSAMTGYSAMSNFLQIYTWNRTSDLYESGYMNIYKRLSLVLTV